jgi:general secretion pathway protein J
MRPFARSSSASGFTLIEILVAMAILAILAVLSWRGLDQVIRGREAVMHSLEEERADVELFEQLRRDTQNLAGTDQTGQPEVQLAPGELRFVRRLALPGIAPRLQVIDYRLEQGHVTRYASAPVQLASDLQTALQRVGSDGNFSATRVGGAITDFKVSAWVPGIGWTDQTADIVAAYTRARSQLFGQVPAPRAVTGLQIRATVAGSVRPYRRVLALGE